MQRYSDNDESRRDVPSFIEPLPPLILNPFMRPRPQKATNLLERFEEDSEIEEPELVQVYLRLKPILVPNRLYEVRSDRCLVTTLDTATAGHGRRTQHNVSKMYKFTKIFDADSNQKEIFEQVVKENLKKLPDGHNFTLLTYGASGSGKTYTLMGEVNSPGLVPRSLEYVFRLVDAAQQPSYKPTENGCVKLSYADQDYELQWVKKLQHVVSAPLRDRYRRMSTQLRHDLTSSTMANRTRYYVWVSFVEIYNEAIYDLLAPPGKRTKLRIREDSSGHVYVKGATYAFVRSGEEAYDVMVAGKHNLVVAATGVHAHSSRSHCIFTINMLTETEGEVRTSCIRLCDLAGCERARATRNTGTRMQESRAINSSLHVLERCLHMLRRKQRQRQEALVPYRESKLTRLLGTGLSGSYGEAVSMVVTLNPSPQYAHETKHVLGLAAVAQDIQINHTMLGSTISLEASTSDSIECEVMRLRADNERLQFELAQSEAHNRELLSSMEEKQMTIAETMQERVAEARDISRQYYEAEIQALKSEMEYMIEEHERELNKLSVPSTRVGTPSRDLQNKVTQLMEEIAILEEKLTAESLARDRAEKEVQHLRTCIEERDEIAFKDNVSEKRDVIYLNCSDSEDDTSDPLNESLEPTFTKEHLNRTQALYSGNDKETSCDESEDCNNDKDEDNDSALENSTNLKDDETFDDTNESNTNVDYTSDIIPDNEFIENHKVQMPHNELSNKHDSVDSDTKLNIIEHGKIIENNEDIKSNIIVEDDKVAQLNDSLETNKLASNLRSTYFLESSENACNNTKDFKTTLPRQTYFVKETCDDTDMNDSNVKMDARGTYFVKNTKEYIGKNKDSCITKNTKENLIKSDTVMEGGESSFPHDVNENSNTLFFYLNDNTLNRDIEKEYPINAEKVTENNIDQKVTEKVSETFINKIIRSVKTTQSSDNSLQNFEQLEIASMIVDNNVKNETSELSALKITKNVRKYFEDSPKTAPNVSSYSNEKRAYFDNIDINMDSKTSVDKKLTAPHPKTYDAKSLSIVADEVSRNLCPSSMKRLLGESFSKKPDVISSVNQNNLLIKKDVSVDIFESPYKLNKTNEKLSNADIARKSIESILGQESTIKTQNEAKLESRSSIKKPVQEFITNNTQNSLNQTELTTSDKTIDAFENIYKDITVPRATEFELLVSQEIKSCDVTQNDVKTEIVENTEATKRNLRDRSRLLKEQKELEKVLSESQSRCASQAKSTKRNLRLRRRKNQPIDEKSDQDIDKLKDIVNLQKEFSDVTMDVPAPMKNIATDIPSLNKMDEEENVSPIQGIQSCPSKMLARSRRKLFTPRVEPLEESLSQTGDSNERIYVPRPSYHRVKARRKL